MKLRSIILILGLLSQVSFMMAQGSEPSVTDWFRSSHLKCENAYKYNNYAVMELSLHERKNAIAEGRLKGLSREDSIEVLGMYHKDRGSYHACLAYMDGSSYSQAKECFEKSINIFKDDALSCSVVRSELAQIHYRCKEYKEALRLLEQNYEFYSRQFLGESLVAFSQVALCKARLGRFDEAVKDIDLALDRCQSQLHRLSDPDTLMQELRRKKGKILILKAESVDKGAVKEAHGYFKDYFAYLKSSVLENFQHMNDEERERYWLRIHPFVADCYRLEDEDPSLLYDVTLFSKNLLLQFARHEDAYLTVDFKDVQKRLDKDECAIEFVRYEAENQIKYGALVLGGAGSPEFVHIGTETELLEHKIFGRNTVKKALGVNAKPLYRDSLYVCESFSRLIWNKELREKLSGAGNVYFSPDGIFHQVAIEYMYPEEVRPSFHRLTSTRELLNAPVDLKNASMLICGGVNYMKADEEDTDGVNDTLAYHLLRKMHLRFEQLKYSMVECDSIYSLRGREQDSLIVGQKVTESACGRLMGQYQIVMLSTHGFFAGKADDFAEELKPRTSDHTMSESVLVLAAAQAHLDNYSFDASAKDGILSARELSSMDLDSVGLFIISACQSGLGRVSPDGVYGIQRGLKNAGVRAMIVSLWNVDDEATKHFMINLNKALQCDGDLQSAFEYARISMDEDVEYKSREYNARKDVGRFVIKKDRIMSKPNYKNAFVLIDNI